MRRLRASRAFQRVRPRPRCAPPRQRQVAANMGVPLFVELPPMPTSRPPVPPVRRPAPLPRWATTLLTAVVAVALRALLQPVLGDRLPFLLAYPAVVFAASMWGIASG